MSVTVIPYHRGLDIRNLADLPRGLGAPYLVVIRSHEAGVYIAARWLRRLPRHGIVISFRFR